MEKLFVFGSLMFDPVWMRLLGRKHPSMSATLEGYRRLRVRGQSYPGLRLDSGYSVSGMLMFDLSAPDLAILDRFEGSEYLRCLVEVQSQDGLLHSCDTYLTHPGYLNRLSDKDWNVDWFRAHELRNFLQQW